MRLRGIFLILLLVAGCTETGGLTPLADPDAPVPEEEVQLEPGDLENQAPLAPQTFPPEEGSTIYKTGDRVTYEGVTGIIDAGTFEDGEPAGTVFSMHEEGTLLPLLYYIRDDSYKRFSDGPELGRVEIIYLYKYNPDKSPAGEWGRVIVKKNGIRAPGCFKLVFNDYGLLTYDERDYLDAAYYPNELSESARSAIISCIG